MDSTGVPHKINRHVYKAVNHLGLDGSNFSNIYQYVRVCTRNLKPVPHLKQTIRRSLNNLQATGIVKMDFKHRYKLKTKYPATMKDNNKVSETTNSNENLSPQARKHKRQQIDSDDDDNYTDEIDNVPKRFKATTKNISRTRMQVKKLPKHRQHDLRNRKSRSCSKVKQPNERSKANVIYKKVNTARSDGIINTEPGSNDKDFINNECETSTRQSKEICYDSRTEEDVKSEKNKIIDNDVKKIDSVLSKNATSYQSNDFEDVPNEPDEQTTDITDSTANNNNAVNNNERPDDDEDANTLNNMRRYNYNYLN